MEPWNRRWLIVLGKGGVGRTTVAMALALAAAREGRRTALVEVNGASSLAELCGFASPAPTARSVARRLDLLSLSAAGCLEAFLVDRMGVAPLARMVFRSRLVSALLDGIPGMTDLLHHGMIHSLVDPARGAYDLVVVDAPATGHGLAFLQTPAALRDMTVLGPIHDETALIAERIEDPSFSGAVLVTLAEELPTSESLDLLEELGPWRRILAGVAVNRVLRSPMPAGLAWSAVRPHVPDPLVAVGDRRMARVAGQQRAIARLVAGLPPDLPTFTLPRLPGPLGRADLETLADAVGEALEAR